MAPTIVIISIAVALVLSLFFSTLTYSLRDFSRGRLGEEMVARGKGKYLQPTLEHTSDLVFVTAVLRLFTNMVILVCVLRMFHSTGWSLKWQYAGALAVTGVTTFCSSVMIPHALARHAPERVIVMFAPLLHALRKLSLPATQLMHLIDRMVAQAVGGTQEQQNTQVDQEIMSAVEDAEEQGVVDEAERAMIESVIEFRATTVGQIMTPRTEIVGLELGAPLDEVKKTLEESGHSRIPVYDGTLDHIVGILYARDLLKHLGDARNQFDMRSAMRPAFYVPETKPLRDLLQDFRLQKVHIAIVLDEYGGTAGLVTIEDVLEELVGEISDEHEPTVPAMLKKIDDANFEADARITVDELNRLTGLSLPEDAGYETLGGFVSITLGHIPEKGESFDYGGNHFEILDAEPQRVNRVRIRLAPPPTEGAHAGATTAGSTVNSGNS
jgi:CBS domain containing-hemolysin-like protein